jgi:beta-glucanase (GH16 family)
LECFKKGTHNVQVTNGSLVITARVEKSKEYMMGEYRRERMRYTSGKIIQSGFGFSYGTYVIRARLPKGKHLLPSIYLQPMGQRHDTCKYEEIDILQARGQRSSTVLVGAHYGRSYLAVASKTMEKVFRNKDFSTDFHEFAVKWMPTRMEW